VPSVSALLAATGEFEKRPQKRYDDTRVLVAEIAEHGFDSSRGREALRVINRAHGWYRISNDDMLYVLSTFIYEPVRWIDRYGWRKLIANEKLAAYHFYAELGRRMGIRDIPPSYADFERFNVDYERKHFRYAESNAAIGAYTLGLFCSWFPRPLRGLARRGVLAMLDEPVRRAFGFPDPPRWVSRLVHGSLRVHAWAERILPKRKVSRLTKGPIIRSYPGYPAGYTVSGLGAGKPPPDIDPAWLRRQEA